MPLVPLGGQSYKSDALPVSAQRCVNFYSEREPSDAKSPVAIFGHPGFSQVAGLGPGPIRAMNVMNNVLYAVSGTELWSLQADLHTSDFLGSGITGSNICGIANNGLQVEIVNGKNGYIFDASVAGSRLTQITAADFHSANTVTFFDEYFIFDWSGTNKWFFSGLLNGAAFAALDFNTAEVTSSFVVGIINQQETLIIFKQDSIETWYDTGANDQPFARFDGGTVERGCLAPLTPIKQDNSVFFLGDDLIFYRLDNSIMLKRVSTHAIEAAWGKYTVASDAFTFTYTYKGHKFVVLTFPSAPATWVYDIATGLWHERESFDSQVNSLGRWRANCAVEFAGLTLFGDAFSGAIGALDGSILTEYGNTIIATLVMPPIHSDRKRVFMASFELDAETGIGIASGQGSDPQIMLDWSDDGGCTFGRLQPWRSLGKSGETKKRVRWTRLGNFRTRMMRVRVSDPVARTLIAAHADLSVGM